MKDKGKNSAQKRARSVGDKIGSRSVSIRCKHLKEFDEGAQTHAEKGGREQDFGRGVFSSL